MKPLLGVTRLIINNFNTPIAACLPLPYLKNIQITINIQGMT